MTLNEMLEEFAILYEKFLNENFGRVPMLVIRKELLDSMTVVNRAVRDKLKAEYTQVEYTEKVQIHESTQESKDRAMEMYNLKINHGMTLEEIGEVFELTLERVRQILTKVYKSDYKAHLAERSDEAIARREEQRQFVLKRQQAIKDKRHAQYLIAKDLLSKKVSWKKICKQQGWSGTVYHQMLKYYPDLLQRPKTWSTKKLSPEVWEERHQKAKKILESGGTWKDVAKNLELNPHVAVHLTIKFPDLKGLSQGKRGRRIKTIKPKEGRGRNVDQKKWEQRYKYAKVFRAQGKTWNEIYNKLNINSNSVKSKMRKLYPDLYSKEKPECKTLGSGAA